MNFRIRYRENTKRFGIRIALFINFFLRTAYFIAHLINISITYSSFKINKC